MRSILSTPDQPLHMRGGNHKNTSAACGTIDAGGILAPTEFEGFYRETERWCCTKCKQIYDETVEGLIGGLKESKIKELKKEIRHHERMLLCSIYPYERGAEREIIRKLKAELKALSGPEINRLRWCPADNCYKLTIQPPDYAYPYTFEFETLGAARRKMAEIKDKFGIVTK